MENSNTPWTPGPWMDAAAPSSIVGWPIVGPGGRSIANVSWQPKPPHVSDADYASFVETCEANAQLIAAAPEMAALIQKYADAWEAGTGTVYLIDEAKALLSRIEGEKAAILKGDE